MPGRGEARCPDAQEVEAITATAEAESPAPTEHLMEAICDSDNIEAALRAVVRNKGAPGVDGITVQQLPGILKARWSEIENQLLQGRYQPQPVRRVKIPKPAGGTRNLGIPTVIDRVIQQAVLQRLQPQWDLTFSEHSYGFRPGRSAHQAVARAQAYVIEGYRLRSSRSPGQVCDGNPVTVSVRRLARPRRGSSPPVSSSSGRIASRCIGTSGTRTRCRRVEMQECR
ncbi:MAG: maturase [Alphaproteobacteria bacterium]|nr:maturase [Alphaproteobacteria bacterium]